MIGDWSLSVYNVCLIYLISLENIINKDVVFQNLFSFLGEEIDEQKVDEVLADNIA